MSDVLRAGAPSANANTRITEKIAGLVLRKHAGRGWLIGFLIGTAFFLLMLVAIGELLAVGVGVWGVNIPVAWGVAITNFVWWIGIGHAGTLISAILLLMRQEWRTSINRFAEAMTLFAVGCAGLFPLLHLGRPWVFYWLFPYPDTMRLWPQFRSPLVWDVFAVSTYLTVSLLFWYVGIVPDLAACRDRATGRVARVLYGIFALGWRGDSAHWQRYERLYLLMAGLATPLVVSVHTVVSFDFAVAILPGWHSTIFPPYFVAGAIFSGFAMVLTLAIPLRAGFHLEEFVTLRHLENMAKVMLATGLIVAYGYLNEIFLSFYSGDIYEKFLTLNRMFGPYWSGFWLLITCNIIVPQFIWSRRIRRSPQALFLIALLVNLGMWTERYIIVVTSLHRDFLPSSWGLFIPTFWDWATFFGSCGFFVFAFFLFLRWLPSISMSELRKLAREKGGSL